MKIFILKDKLANMPAGVPFFSESQEAAIRDCLLQFKGHENTLNQFDLYCIGEYDRKGSIVNMDNSLICNMRDGQGIIDKFLD